MAGYPTLAVLAARRISDANSRPRRRIGGAYRDRTDDPLLAKQVLSQLSYSPKRYHVMVGLGRLELPTSPLSGVRSNQTELQAQT